MAEDICFEIIFEVFCWIILSAFFDYFVYSLMESFGLDRGPAEALVMVSAIMAFFLFAVNNARKRKLLGKAVVLDTDGDGEISEEEAAAFHHHDDDEPEGWWESD